ncbi:hypothetical protein ACHAWF_007620, partial [Thalassiosira exigua]
RVVNPPPPPPPAPPSRPSDLSPWSASQASLADSMQKDSGEESNEDGDEDLLAAASEWASAQDDDDAIDKTGSATKAGRSKESVGETDRKVNRALHNPTSQKFSLHLTKVPYEATQTEIRFAFGEFGCHVTSVRLVYDRDQKSGEKHFRGVAFVDLADEKSFERGLELHNTTFLGNRKVNVRPTRTKSELSEIVRRTEEKVANLIARSKEKAQKKEIDQDAQHSEDAKDEGKSKKSKKNKKRKKRDRIDEDGCHQEEVAPTKKPKRKDPSKGTEYSNESDQPKEKRLGSTESNRDGKKTKKRRKSRSSDIPESDNEPPKPTDQTHGQKAKKKKKKSAGGSAPTKDTPTESPKVDTLQTETGSNAKRVAKKNAGGSPVKLTKKQRAKKAAVIRMMKLKGKKGQK